MALAGAPGVVSADALSPISVSGSGASSANGLAGNGSGASSSLEGSLVIPGGLDQGQQLQAVEQARLANPEAVAARRRSRTEFVHLGTARAAQVAREAFPGVVDRPAGVASLLPAGVRITRYVSADAAQLELAGGKRAVVESTGPIAKESAPGRYTPLDLGLTNTASGYAPVSADVAVRIPKRLGGGVALGASGVSLTAVDAQGAPLNGAEGALDGATMLYANTQTDTDTVVKPKAEGFEIDDMLRSPASPGTLYFRVGLPAGAHLVHGRASDAAKIVSGGKVIAAVLPPDAQDAAGTSVPVSMSLSGDTLVLTVGEGSGEYQYPIEVDPTVTDKLLTSGEKESNWVGEVDSAAKPRAFELSTGNLELSDFDNNQSEAERVDFERGQWALFGYETQGESRIYGLIAETEGTGSNMENFIGIKNHVSKAWEAVKTEPASYSKVSTEVCVVAGCPAQPVTSGTKENAAVFEQVATNNGWGFSSTMSSAAVEIEQEKGPTISYDVEKEFPSGGKNPLYGNGWSGHGAPDVLAQGADPGLGVSWMKATSPNKSGWFQQLFSAECTGAQCEPKRELFIGTKELPAGEDTIESKVEDPVGLTSTVSTKVKVDWEAPHNITLLGLPSNDEIGSGQYALKVSATDGVGSTQSSGMASIKVEINGKVVIAPSGSCSPGPCAATSNEVKISGEEYGVGVQVLTVTATDNAGNVAVQSFNLFTGHPATPVPMGPGTVNPETGAFTLSATDVSIGAPGAGLSLVRSYNSMHLTAGASDPLGPQWEVGLGGEQSLTKLPNGSMVLTSSEGPQATFFSKGGGEFNPPPGDSTVVLKEKVVESKTEYVMTDASGTSTTFVLPGGEGSSGNVWVPTVREGPNSTGAVRFAFETKKGIIEATQELAPVQAGVSCSSKLEPGCRALTFTYAEKTTATGEKPSEWGEYEGRLVKVSLTAYNPSTKAMATTAVAQYSFDKQGRLRAEWDPRISPALKTTYGYDPEGHVTALSSPGVQPWTFTYGTIANDTRTGRLLAVTRPSASTAFGSGEAPVKSTAPALSTTHPLEGSTISVSTGSWSNSPVSYSYQWEHCYSESREEGQFRVCVPILGATNQTYTPTLSDYGDELFAVVTATNMSGSTVAECNASADEQRVAYWKKSSEFGSTGEGTGQFKGPWGVAIGEQENVFVADSGNNRIEKFSSSGGFLKSFGSKGSGVSQFNAPEGIATFEGVEEKLLLVADSGNNRVASGLQELESDHNFTVAKAPAWVAATRVSHNELFKEALYVTNPSQDRIEEFPMEAGYPWNDKLESIGSEGTGNGQFKSPAGIATDEGGEALYVVDEGNDRVEKFRNSKYFSQFGSKGSGNGQFSSPRGIAIAGGKIYVVDSGNKRVEEFNEAGEYLSQFAVSSEARGIAVNGKHIYVTDGAANKVEIWEPTAAPNPIPAPPTPGTSAVSTVEYHVPVSGTSTPYAMGSSEVGQWAQKDDPVDAAAFFPPDEPMGWPAQDYKRASVYYLDSRDRTVNVAQPGGAISTTEYTANNDVERTLSADNRAAALKEGCKSEKECASAEKSKLLDNESTYNTASGEPGSELTSTLGPRHTVKLASGSTVEARTRTIYSHNEGAPTEGGPYHLVTKTTQGALLNNGEEKDVRTTATSYSGQGNLGWKLRKPTSVTTDPGGLNLVHTMVYEASTGEIKETKQPESEPSVATYTYASVFGSWGHESGELSGERGIAIDSSGNLWVADTNNNRVEKFSPEGKALLMLGKEGTGAGEFKEPRAIAIDSKGDIWVSDFSNHRVQEFSSSGVFIRMFGWGVKDGKAEEEVCTSSCHIGIAGGGKGQFWDPYGLAFDSKGDAWVADTGGNRVEELSSEGKYMAEFGSKGSAKGQLDEPRGVAFDSKGNIWVADSANNRIQEFSTTTVGEALAVYGTAGAELGQFNDPIALAFDSKGNLWVADMSNSRLQELSSSGAYMQTIGSKGSGHGQLSGPGDLALDSTGDIWVADTENNRVEEWTPGNVGAHATQTIYYTTAASSEYPTCGKHPEWAALPCESKPAAQPGTSGLPELPITTVTYNMWDEPETTTETVGTTTRTKTTTYEASGRPEKSAISSTVGTALPTVTDEYNKETGALETQSTGEGKTKLSSHYNALGQLTSYTDAASNTATYEYDIDGRLAKTNDGKGTQTYTYETSPSYTGDLTKLVDSAAGTFTASYDVEGNLLTEGYPNGMNANYAYNQIGTPTALEYVKTTHCTEKCTWFSDAVVPSIHGQWLEQTSTLSHQAYTYDNAGRLTQVQSTPAGVEKPCQTREYVYDEDTNRTTLNVYKSNESDGCAHAEIEHSESHAYDTADRLIDTGVKYNEFGDITNLPSADAGGSELTSSYYTDNQLASETQNGQTIGYNLDPAGRTLETVKTGKTASDTTNHYAGPGNTPAWTVNTSGETTRDISGISGFAAVQNNAETPVLQLTNLHGDIIATAYLSETATALASTADTSEFGVPTTSLPPKYSWLGANEIPTELPSGILDMGARSYIPQLGRFLQPDPQPGGSANAYTYTFGDPVDSSDPSGERTAHLGAWVAEAANQNGQEVTAREVARETLEREEAERRAREAQEAAEAAAGPQYGEEGGEEWEEYEEEEGEYEYASYHQGEKTESGEGQMESAVLVQSLNREEAGNGEGTATLDSAVPLCKADLEGPCTHDARLRRGAKCYRSSSTYVGPEARPGTPGDSRNRAASDPSAEQLFSAAIITSVEQQIDQKYPPGDEGHYDRGAPPDYDDEEGE